jgi:SSS family solute:Na+ symporter
MYLIFFTQFATIMGAGNFMGHAGSGYANGLPWLVFIAGEQGAKVIFALVFAGLAGRFCYNTFPEMIDDLITRDKVTRALAGLLASCIMVAWVGGQGKAFGDLFAMFSGADPVPIIFLFTVIFVIYTTVGGIYSVVWTDFLQGVICVVTAVVFYSYALAEVNFSFAEIGARLNAVGKGDLWSFAKTDTVRLVTLFVTGFVGILVAQIYWQRCYAAKDSRTACHGLLWSGIIAIVMTMLTAVVGFIILTMNQDLKQSEVMPWFLMNHVPLIVSATVFVLILAAGMSSADSNLNSSAVLLVNDLITPFCKNMQDKTAVRLAKIFTVVLGAFAAVAAIYASNIIALFSRSYQMAGAGLVPLLTIGMLWKEKPGERFQMGKRNSRVTPWGARVGIVVGAVLSQITSLGPNRLLWALAASSVCVVIVSLKTRGSKLPDSQVSEGFTGVNSKSGAGD